MIDYEYMYRAVVRRLVEIADEAHRPGGRTLDVFNQVRLADYDRVARAHEPNIEEEGNVS